MCIHWETLVGLLRHEKPGVKSSWRCWGFSWETFRSKLFGKTTCGEHSKPKFMLSNKKHQQTRNLLDNFLLWTFQNVKKQSNYKPNIASALSNYWIFSSHCTTTVFCHCVLSCLAKSIFKNTLIVQRGSPPKKNTHVFQRKHENRSHIHVFGWVVQKSSLEKTNRINSYHLPSRFNR